MSRIRHLGRSRVFSRRRLSIAVTIGLMAVGWIWFVGSLHAHEMMVGAVIVALSAAFCALVYRSETLRFELRWRDVVQCWHIPWAIIARCSQISWLLVWDLAGQRVGSFYRVCGFRTGMRDPVAVERSVLAVLYSTAAPNFIVIGIDPHQNHMLFHQIERSEVSTMTKALGAEG